MACPGNIYVCPRNIYVCPGNIYVCPRSTYVRLGNIFVSQKHLFVSQKHICVPETYMCVTETYMCVPEWNVTARRGGGRGGLRGVTDVSSFAINRQSPGVDTTMVFDNHNIANKGPNNNWRSRSPL